MSRKLLSIVFVVAIGLVAAFSTGAQMAEEPTTSTSSVYRFSDSEPVDGAQSQLTRYANGVTTTINTSELNTGEVYTLWWVIFNEPQNCSGGVCNLDDIFAVDADGIIPRDEAGNRVMNMDGITAANISVQHASGSLSTDGSFSVSASLGLGDVPGIVFGPGLLNAQKAEVHLVVRTHGEKVDEAFPAQISSFGGGCDPMDAAPCDDVQYAIFLPAE